jgi:hypothetical protein
MFHAAADQRDVGAGFGECARNASGDTSAATGHESDLALQNSFCEDCHFILLESR